MVPQAPLASQSLPHQRAESRHPAFGRLACRWIRPTPQTPAEWGSGRRRCLLRPGLLPVVLPSQEPVAGQRQSGQGKTRQYDAQASSPGPRTPTGLSRRPVVHRHDDRARRGRFARTRCQRHVRAALPAPARREDRVVARLLVGVEQTDFRRRDLVQQLLRQLDVLAVLKSPQMGHLPIGRRQDHVRIRFEQIHAQQPIVARRPRRIADTKPLMIRVEARTLSLAGGTRSSENGGLFGTAIARCTPVAGGSLTFATTPGRTP